METKVMIPVWFFILLIGTICTLMYITRTTEDGLIVYSKNQIRKLQEWFNMGRASQSAER